MEIDKHFKVGIIINIVVCTIWAILILVMGIYFNLYWVYLFLLVEILYLALFLKRAILSKNKYLRWKVIVSGYIGVILTILIAVTLISNYEKIINYNNENSKPLNSSVEKNTSNSISKEDMELDKIEETYSLEDALNLVYNNDHNYIDNYIDYYDIAPQRESFSNGFIETWQIPNEDYYSIVVRDIDGDKWIPYVVGKQSGKVYRCPTQGGLPIIEVMNNMDIQVFDYYD